MSPICPNHLSYRKPPVVSVGTITPFETPVPGKTAANAALLSEHQLVQQVRPARVQPSLQTFLEPSPAPSPQVSPRTSLPVSLQTSLPSLLFRLSSQLALQLLCLLALQLALQLIWKLLLQLLLQMGLPLAARGCSAAPPLAALC